MANKKIKIPKYPTKEQILVANKHNKIMSPGDAKIYGAGQKGVTEKPFSKKWANKVGNNIKKLMTEGSYKKGGKVKKTGIYKLHKGEIVMTKKQQKKMKSKMKGKKIKK